MKAPSRHAKQIENGWLVTVTPPRWSGFKRGQIELTNDQYRRYLKWLADGTMIQHRLPDLSSEQREILISGIMPHEWDQAFENR